MNENFPFPNSVYAISTDDPLSFGKILVLDDVITGGPGLDSKEMGKFQGIIYEGDSDGDENQCDVIKM